jgi:pyruvate dehydrogenase E2 component (dihydrolipoamide acetyltransferase)
MSMITEVAVPDIGDFKNIPVIEIQVKPGDVVRADDPLVTLESDKATLEVPAPAAGRVVELLVALGATVSQGSPLLRLEAEAEAEAPAAVASPTPLVAITPQSGPPDDLSRPAPAILAVVPSSEAFQPASAGPAHASPSVRVFAREVGLDIARIAGTGPKGRILRDDVLAHVKAMVSAVESPGGGGKGLGFDLVPWPQVDFAKYGEIARAPLSRVRKISGPALARNWVMIPHVTNFDEADVTDIEEFRQAVNREKAEGDAKVSMLAFLIKASAETLKAFPQFNASLDGEELVLKRYYRLGFAADTPNGLVVPVIRDADRMGIRQIADELSALAGQARQGKLKPADMQGGSFTISSLGGIGGTGFTPIINAPEVAILGAAKAQLKPIWDGGQFRPRLILPLGLSWDHRVVYGAAAGRFLDHLRCLLGDLRRILL